MNSLFFKQDFLHTTYRNCGLKYRYQEWTDGLHNVDDHLLMSLHMCIHPAPFTPGLLLLKELINMVSF